MIRGVPRLAAVAVCLLVHATGCAPGGRRDGQRVPLRGTVVGKELTPPRVVVAHDAIDEVMPAMTMSFEVRDPAVILLEGDRIAATLVITGSGSWLEEIEVTGPVDRGRADPSVARPVTVGTIVPALSFVDQNGDARSLHESQGRVLVVTFIYTRCPMPDLCPLMVSHLEHIRRRSNESGIGDRVRFLGVTLDPVFDTPEILRAFGVSRLKGDEPFDQWTLAGGTVRQIDDLARFFGVGYRVDSALVVHTLATAVVGADSRIVGVFPSNSWRPDEAFETVQRAVARASSN
jgi:protein SCO1/2